MPTINVLAKDMMKELGVPVDEVNDPGTIALYESFCNDALGEIALRGNWRFFQLTSLLNTVAGTAIYNLPVNVREIRQIRFTGTNEPVEFRTAPFLSVLGTDLELQGKPRFWLAEDATVSGSDTIYRIRLYPVPSAVYELQIFSLYHPADVASASQLPVQGHFVELIKDRVRAFHLARHEKWDGAALAYNRFRENLQVVINKEQRKFAARTRLKVRDIGRSDGEPRVRLDPNYFH